MYWILEIGDWGLKNHQSPITNPQLIKDFLNFKNNNIIKN